MLVLLWAKISGALDSPHLAESLKGILKILSMLQKKMYMKKEGEMQYTLFNTI